MSTDSEAEDISEMQGESPPIDMYPYFRLPPAALYNGRQDFVIARCEGKRVLHIGCVDAGLLEERYRSGELMHQRLAEVASELHGTDVDRAGLAFMRDHGFQDLHYSDASTVGELPEISGKTWDVIVATELMEHLSNPGLFLDSVRTLMDPETELIITVPNAFRVRTLLHLLRGVEYVHPDHNYWYSYHTITGLVAKHGLRPAEVAAYTFHPGGKKVELAHPAPAPPAGESSGAPIRRLARAAVKSISWVLFPLLYRTTPFWGDGIIIVARLPEPPPLVATGDSPERKTSG